MKSRTQRRLSRHLEPGWTLTVPGVGYAEDPLTGNRRPAKSVDSEVAVSIQQRLTTQMTETGVEAVRDERVAVFLPVVEAPPSAVLTSPRGERWNCTGEAMVRRTAYRKPVYTAVPVRRAKEGDRR